jgi:myosin tail region-interacting protein MTI1
MSSLPFKVKAIFDYTSPHEDDLHFQDGQIITVTEDDEEDWYTGEYVDTSGVKQEGIFPRNFVEKYEPTAPPRPTRSSRPKKDTEPSALAVTLEPSNEPSARNESQEQGNGEAREPMTMTGSSRPGLSSACNVPPAISQPTEAPAAAVKLASKPAPTTKPSGPPPVSEKPTSGSFRDRIAAFNKPAAPPVAPFKPGGFGASGSSFIKKPFVAPPPSKDSYVPIPREPAPQRIYRREEDPEIAAREAENLENAERAGLAPTNDGDGEDLPKPASLKERIALLQKQQMEQAARHAEAAQKKEKPKRPVKKRTESYNVGEGPDEGEGMTLERQESYDTIGKKSMDSTREESLAPRGLPRRKSSKGPPTHPGFPRESFDDGNDADMSGAGNETEEPEEISTGRDDSDDKPRARAPTSQHRASVALSQEPRVGEEEGNVEEEQEGDKVVGEEEEEEEDIDPEIRRKEELRARMAKMSGGMGMHGMFGPPGGMPLPGPGLPPKKKKASASNEKIQSIEYRTESASLPSARAPPVPGIPLPGLTQVRSHEETNKKLEQEDEPQEASIGSTSQPHEVSDIEDTKSTRTVPQRSLSSQGMIFCHFCGFTVS